MCGVFGFVSNGGKLNVQQLEAIAKDTERRGPHAFGFAWVDGKGRLHSFKQRGRISSHLALLRMAKDARVLIGHCRWTTQGTEFNNANNHPHAADGGWIVHNGVIPGYHGLLKAHKLKPVSDCDSEVLGLLIEREDGALTKRCKRAVRKAVGAAQPLVMLGLWARPARLVYVKQGGNPLHWGQDEGGTYLASYATALPGDPMPIEDGDAYCLTPERAAELV